MRMLDLRCSRELGRVGNSYSHYHSSSFSCMSPTHANGITQLMTAQAEIDKLGASDQLRAEIDKIIAAASSTWTSCVEFRAETSKFAQEAFASHKILEEQLLADGTRMRQELERSELFRRRGKPPHRRWPLHGIAQNLRGEEALLCRLYHP